MKRKSLLALAAMLCVPIATLFVHGTYAADSYGSLGFSIPKGKKCDPQPAAPGYKWYGKAPFCKPDAAKKDCKKDEGTVYSLEDPILPYCGDGKQCETGYKILCKMPGADTYQQGTAPPSSDGSWTTVTTQSGTDSGESVTNTSTGKTSYVRYLGKRPFCNADNKVSECKNLNGVETGRSKCNDVGECCTSGKYLQCTIEQTTGG